jgi:chemotaxis protein histidine kinase CheA
MSDDIEMLDEFRLEATELLDEAEDSMLLAEKQTDLKTNYDKVFRSFHSLKGSAGMFGLDELQRHMHLIEDHLQKHKSDLSLFASHCDFYIKAIDAARKLLTGEMVKFNYELQNNLKIPEVVKECRRIVYVCRSKSEDMKRVVEPALLNLEMESITVPLDSHTQSSLNNQQYDVIITDLPWSELIKVIPKNKDKTPVMLITDMNNTISDIELFFGILDSKQDEVSVRLAVRNALTFNDRNEVYSSAKWLIMYMYSDLEQALLEKGNTESQRILNIEIRNFVKKFA